MDKLARFTGEQIASIGSQDKNDAVWLKLARRANGLLATPDVDGIVITHGTMVKVAIAAGAEGIVLAGVGDGNATAPMIEALAEAVKQGVVVVRSTRGGCSSSTEVEEGRRGMTRRPVPFLPARTRRAEDPAPARRAGRRCDVESTYSSGGSCREVRT